MSDFVEHPPRPREPQERHALDADHESRTDFFFGGDGLASPARAPIAPGFAAQDAIGPRAPVAGHDNWIPVGPRNIGGRITALAHHPTDPLVIYAGTAAGGVHKTVDGGDTWFALFHEQASLAVGALALSPSRPDRIWVASGDPRPGGGGKIRGRGIYVSDDAGANWNNPVPPGGPPANPKPFGLTFEAMAADPIDADFCWALGPAGVFRTDDGGATWHRFAGTEDPGKTGIRWWDVAFSHATVGMQPLYLVRTGGDRLENAATNSGLVIRIENPRDPFVAIEPLLIDPAPPAALPASYMPVPIPPDNPAVNPPRRPTRGKIALTPADVDTAYVRWVDGNDGHLSIHRCDDMRNAVASAAAWVSLSRTGGPSHQDDHPTWPLLRSSGDPVEGQGGYNLTLAVSPLDADHVATGMIDLYTTRVGTNPAVATAANPMWIRAMAWEIYESHRAHHADHHALTFDQAGNLWAGNDGGLAVSTDAFLPDRVGYADKTVDDIAPQTLPLPANVTAWRKRSHGMNVSMPYSISQSPTVPALYGCGYQDNGVFITTGGESWTFLVGADGGFVAFDPDDPYQMYVTWQGGVGHLEIPARVEGTLPTPGELFRDTVWPRTLNRGFLPGDDPRFTADTVHDPRATGVLFNARHNRIYRLGRETGDDWRPLRVGRSVELLAHQEDNASTLAVLASTAAPKLGFEPQGADADAKETAIIRSTRSGPYTLANGDQLSLLVNGAAHTVTFNQRGPADPDGELNLAAPLSPGQVAAEISRVLAGVVGVRAEAVFWDSSHRVEIITDAVGPDPLATITVTDNLNTAQQFQKSDAPVGVYAPAPGQPAVVGFSYATLNPVGGVNRKLSIQVGGRASVDVEFDAADFTRLGWVDPAQIARHMATVLAGEPVRVELREGNRGVRLQANPGVNLRFSRSAREVLGLPNSTGAGGASVIDFDARTSEKFPDWPPAPLDLRPMHELTIDDGTETATVTFDPDNFFSPITALTPAEIEAEISNALTGTPAIAGSVALAGAAVTVTADPGIRLRFSGSARAVLGFPATTAVAGSASFNGPQNLESTDFYELRIRDGVRNADLTFDAAAGFNNLGQVQATELLRFLGAAFSATPLRGRVETDIKPERAGRATEIAFDHVRPGRVWAGSESGAAYASDDHGATWRRATDPPSRFFRRQIEALAFHPTDDDVVYLGSHGSFGDDTDLNPMMPANDPGFLFRSDDDGQSWVGIGAGVTDSVGNQAPITALATDPAEPDWLYAASSVGVFRSLDRGQNWTSFNENLPNARVKDMVIEPTTRTLRAALWGRSVFERRLGPGPVNDVHLYVRATMLDDGTDRQRVLGPDLLAFQPASVLPHQSPDIKVVPTVPASTGFVDGVEFDEDFHHEPPRAGPTKLLMQLHNRGAFEAPNVRVICLFADASVAPPALPDDFWDLVAAGTLPEAVGDWTRLFDDVAAGPSGSAQDRVLAGQPRVVVADVDFPPDIEAMERLGILLLCTSPDDPITTTETDLSRLIATERRIAYRETSTTRAADANRFQLIGRIRDRTTPFNVAAPAADSALARLGLANAVGLTTITGVGDNADGTFDLTIGGGPRGVTIAYPDVTIPITFEQRDMPGNPIRAAGAWEVRDILNRAFVEHRAPVRAVLEDRDRRARIEGRGVDALGNQVVRVSIAGGNARTRLGLPNGGPPRASVRTARHGFDLRPGGRVLNVVYHVSHTVRFNAADFGSLAAATADEIRAVMNRDFRGLALPVEAVVPTVALRVRRSISDVEGPGSVTGRGGLADVVASDAPVVAPDQPALFAMTTVLGDDQLVAGANELYVRVSNAGNAAQVNARVRCWEAQLPATPGDPVTLADIDDTTDDVVAGGETIVHFSWTPSAPAAASGQRRVVFLIADHPTERPLEPPAFASFADFHEFCRRHPGAAYREFVVI
ncbi:MAG: hypothetical protein AAGA37_13680 [Actinomycetota bacterium]